jgi:nucleoside triphosphate pyrophosphatase
MSVRFVLASSSPRRRELLKSIGLDFDVVPSHIPEERAQSETPEEYVARLSREKAMAIAEKHPDRWIIAADTTVVLGEQVLEKPADDADAKRMLSAISGVTHIVFTGVTLRRIAPAYADTHVTATEVRMLPMTAKDIDWYIATGEPRDKAGAYAAQGLGGMFIDSIHGSFTNVVGLPLASLFQMLRKAGIDPLYNRPNGVH